MVVDSQQLVPQQAGKIFLLFFSWSCPSGPVIYDLILMLLWLENRDLHWDNYSKGSGYTEKPEPALFSPKFCKTEIRNVGLIPLENPPQREKIGIQEWNSLSTVLQEEYPSLAFLSDS